MAKWVKNSSGASKTWVGQLIADEAYYQLEAAEESKWANNSTVLTDIGSGDLVVAKDDSESTDFSDVAEAINYLKDALPQDMRAAEPFPKSGGYRFRGTGVAGTATKNMSSNIDYKMPEDRMINAVHLLLDKHVWGDVVKFQVVDVDGVYYSAGTVLDEFASSWNVDPTLCSQRPEQIDYPAKVLKDLYVRVVYSSVGTVDDVKVSVNLYLHKVP